MQKQQNIESWGRALITIPIVQYHEVNVSSYLLTYLSDHNPGNLVPEDLVQMYASCGARRLPLL